MVPFGRFAVGVQSVEAEVIVGVRVDLVVDLPAPDPGVHAEIFEVARDVVVVVVVVRLARGIPVQRVTRAVLRDLRRGRSQRDVLVDRVDHRHHGDQRVLARRLDQLEEEVLASLAEVVEPAVGAGLLVVDERRGVAVALQLAGIELDAAEARIEAPQRGVGRDRRARERVLGGDRDRAAEGRRPDGAGAAGTAVDDDLAEVLSHEVGGGVVREVVRVAPGDAVEGHVELPVGEAAHRHALRFRHPGPFGSTDHTLGVIDTMSV